QLDRADPELAQPGEARDHRVERALLRERADVQLVDDQLLERELRSTGDLEARRVDHARWAEDALRLEAGARVGERLAAFDDVPVVVARSRGQPLAPRPVAI